MTNKEFFIQTWQSEMKSTLNAIKGLPSDTGKWTYKCHEKARSAAELIGHMLPHAEVMAKATSSFIADEHRTPKKFTSVEEAAGYFEKWSDELIGKVSAMDEKTWNEQPVEFRVDGKKLYEFPMSATGWLLMKDIIHHRGQLSTYYRQMGVRNPSIYGPTAEDIEEMMAASKN
jgi:uncharacterized damage-inducible protein DinB